MASLTLRKRSKNWYIAYREPGSAIQKYKSTGTSDKAMAEQKLLVFEAIFEARRLGIAVDTKTERSNTFEGLFSEYLRFYRAHYLSANVERVESIWRNHLRPAIGTLQLSELSHKIVQDYIHQRLLEAKPGTVAKEINTFRAALNWARDNSLLTKIPVNAKAWRVRGLVVHDDSEPFYFLRPDLEAIIAASLKNYQSLPKQNLAQTQAPYAHIWRLMVNTGLRRSEAMRARVSHIRDAGSHKILFVENKKNSEGVIRKRRIPLNDSALDAIEQLQPDDYVLPRITPQTLSKNFMRDRIRAGVERGSLHWLRHTFITYLAESGAQVETIRVLAGHRNLKTTQRYMWMVEGQDVAAVTGLEL
jgi:integrase